MTELDIEIQYLRRENERLRGKLRELENVHQLDLAEITKLRRMVGRYEEGKR